MSKTFERFKRQLVHQLDLRRNCVTGEPLASLTLRSHDRPLSSGSVVPAKGWPKTSEYIFPYDPRSICAAFTRACHVLGIKDLRVHDLRHEATSRPFERGYQIHEVCQFTLHESWNELKRYTNLRPEKVREIPEAVESNAESPRKKRPSSAREAVNQPSVAVNQSALQGRPH